MDELVFLFIGYWFAVTVVFLLGLIKLIIAGVNGKSSKGGLKLLIGSVIMLVIGAGACALMLS